MASVTYSYNQDGFNTQNIYSEPYHEFVDQFKLKLYLTPTFTKWSTKITGTAGAVITIPKPVVPTINFIDAKKYAGIWTGSGPYSVGNTGLTITDVSVPMTVVKNEIGFSTQQLTYTYLSKMLNPGSIQSTMTLPDEFLVVAYITEAGARAIDSLLFGNVINMIQQDSGSTRLHFYGTTLTSGGTLNIVNEINYLYQNIYDPLKTVPSVIFVSLADFNSLEIQYVNLNLYHITPDVIGQNGVGNDGYLQLTYPYNRNFQIVATPYLNQGQVFMTSAWNLISCFGTGDSNLMKVWWKEDEQQVRTRIELALASSMYFLEYISSNF